MDAVLRQGVNLGVALPGRFPAEFPLDSALYAGWLDTIAGMRANTVRVYTILPPAFYRALRGWNRTHPARALWLVHGVWTELPPGNDFDDAAVEGGVPARDAASGGRGARRRPRSRRGPGTRAAATTPTSPAGRWATSSGGNGSRTP